MSGAKSKASPNDGVSAHDLYDAMNAFYNGIGPMSSVVVVDPGEKVRDLEIQLARERAERVRAQDDVSRLKLLLKRAEERSKDARLDGDPITTPHGEACGRQDCAAVRTEVIELRKERADLRKRLMRAILKPQ